MKKLILMLILLTTFVVSAYANTALKAKKLYKKRGEDVENAAKAAKIYGDLAEKATDNYKKAKFLYRQSEATFYVGSKLPAGTDTEKETKIATYAKGFEVAKTGYELLEGNTSNSAQVKTLARLYFFYGANLGQWANTRGIMASLKYKDDLFEAMDKIVDIGMRPVDNYGANRISGRVYYKLPKLFGGDKKRAEKELAEAFDNTQAPNAACSVHGLNNIYYAEVLKARKKKEKACEILKVFSEQDYKTLLKTRIPETKEEIEEAKEKFDDWKCKKVLNR